MGNKLAFSLASMTVLTWWGCWKLQGALVMLTFQTLLHNNKLNPILWLVNINLYIVISYKQCYASDMYVEFKSFMFISRCLQWFLAFVSVI